MTTRLYGKATECANLILEAFKKPDDLPDKLATVYLTFSDSIPCAKWSWGNRLIMAMSGFRDARGFRQWKQAGRHVKKGEKSFLILAPCHAKIKDKESGKEKQILVGFRAIPVFGYQQTDGDELPDIEKHEKFIDSLPVIEVAREWGVDVSAFDATQSNYMGYATTDQKQIGIGVENLSVFAHEMIHNADMRNGTLKETGQHPQSESVAELGSAVLLTTLGYESQADLSRIWEWITQYAEQEKKEPISLCLSLLNRTCDCVQTILDAADRLAGVENTEQLVGV